MPTGAINPVTVADQGGLDMLAQTGEYLCLSDQTLTLKPVLATSWTPNSTADVWTFKIRQGVKFHNGAALTADDVVYTYKLQTNPTGKSNALSALGGVLTPSGVQKVDDFTVAFHLEAPNGNFPYLTSSDNYNMIIIPNNYDPANWQSSFVGTGPFVMKSYTAKVGASFTRNEQYWGTKALPAGTEFTFYADQTPEILALSSGTIDVVGQFAVSGGEQLLASGAPYNVIRLKSSAHRELSMRCDQAPFTDPRVRQAIALTLDRPAIVQALFKGYADLGNDSPFAPVFPSTNTSVPQRAQDIAKAKSLLAAAGHSTGFSSHPHHRAARARSRSSRRSWCSPRRPSGSTSSLTVETLVDVLRPGHVRELGLARRHHEPGRLRPPRRAQRVPDRGTGDDQREDRDRLVERGALQQRAVRQAGRPVRRHRRPVHPAHDRRADPDPAARPDADHLSGTSTTT